MKLKTLCQSSSFNSSLFTSSSALSQHLNFAIMISLKQWRNGRNSNKSWIFKNNSVETAGFCYCTKVEGQMRCDKRERGSMIHPAAAGFQFKVKYSVKMWYFQRDYDYTFNTRPSIRLLRGYLACLAWWASQWVLRATCEFGYWLHSPHSTASKLSSTELFCKQLLRGEINIHTAQANVWQVQQHKEVEN